MKKRIGDIVTIVVALLLAVGVSTVFSGCGPKEDGSWMHCHTAQIYVFRLGLAIALLTIVRTFFNSQFVKTILGGITVVLAIVTVLIPGVIVPLCMMETMHCHSVMKPFVRVVGVILVAVGIVNEIIELKSKEVKDEENLQTAFN